MTNIFLLRSIGISEDSRAMRFANLYTQSSLNVIFVDWATKKKADSEFKISFWLPRMRDKPLINIFLLPIFSFWLLFVLMRHCKAGDIVHAIDLDTALPAVIISHFIRIRVIFDIADPFDMSRIKKKMPTIEWIEKIIAEKSDLVTLPDMSRKIIYSDELSKVKNILAIENVSDYMDRSSVELSDIPKVISNRMRLVYCGTLEPNVRGLENLIKLTHENLSCELVIGGIGGLSEWIASESKKNNRITFVGQFQYDDIWKLYQKSDVIIGLYYLASPLHKWAAPNKYYEHLMAKKPLLTTKGTPPGTLVEQYGTGWSILDTYNAMFSWFQEITNDECKRKGVVAGNVWSLRYHDYWKVGVKKILLDDYIYKWMKE